MELAIHKDDADILLKEKNVLNEPTVEKYRVAGQVAQTCLQYLLDLIRDSYHLQKTAQPYTCQELCILGDSYLKNTLDNVYKNGAVRERGISHPTTIEVNDIVSGFSPELDDPTPFIFSPGDIVTISLGAQIDGYTANVSHTIVIYPPGQDKPAGPLLGGKADSICAAHIATETVVSLLGCALSPEKLPSQLNVNGQVTGATIRKVVDSIAKSYNCVVVPGSKVRRIRRFLAGQAEGIVAEKDFKGVVWSEKDQELELIKKATTSKSTELISNDSTHSNRKAMPSSSAIPTDDFAVYPGEAYNIDIKMASLSDFNQVGIVTLETVESLTGLNNKENVFRAKPTIFIRDVIIKHALKLKSARQLLGKIDKQSVYPFKLSHMSSNFPINIKEQDGDKLQTQIKSIEKDLKLNKLALAEINNRHLVRSKPIEVAKFISLDSILRANNNSGVLGFDASKQVLPGLELPLPELGISGLKLKSLLKNSEPVAVARESTSILLAEEGTVSQSKAFVLRLTGGSKLFAPSWVHSKYNLGGDYLESISQLDALTKDKKYGIKIKQCHAFKISEFGGEMQIDE